MKALIITTLLTVSFSASAAVQHNCAAQANTGRENNICNNSLLSDATKVKYQCAREVKAQEKGSKIVR